MTLDKGKIGLTYQIKTINLPLQLEKRLQSLGMTNGTQVKVVSNKSHGTLIIKLRGTRFAIGKGISKNIELWGEKNNE